MVWEKSHDDTHTQPLCDFYFLSVLRIFYVQTVAETLFGGFVSAAVLRPPAGAFPSFQHGYDTPVCFHPIPFCPGAVSGYTLTQRPVC